MIAKIETKYKISKTFFADTHFTCSNIDESKNNFTTYLKVILTRNHVMKV